MKLQKSMVTMQARQSAENQRKELNMTLVLACIVVMFIFCQSVKIIPDIYEAVVCDHTQVCTRAHILVGKKSKFQGFSSLPQFGVQPWQIRLHVLSWVGEKAERDTLQTSYPPYQQRPTLFSAKKWSDHTHQNG